MRIAKTIVDSNPTPQLFEIFFDSCLNDTVNMAIIGLQCHAPCLASHKSLLLYQEWIVPVQQKTNVPKVSAAKESLQVFVNQAFTRAKTSPTAWSVFCTDFSISQIYLVRTVHTTGIFYAVAVCRNYR